MTKEKTFESSSDKDVVFVMQIKVRVVTQNSIRRRPELFYYLSSKFIQTLIATFGSKLRIDTPPGYFGIKVDDPTARCPCDIEILPLGKQDDVLRLFR
jgi:hypothetical protein